MHSITIVLHFSITFNRRLYLTFQEHDGNLFHYSRGKLSKTSMTQNETKDYNVLFKTFKISGGLIAIFNFWLVSLFKIDDLFGGKGPISKDLPCKGLTLFFEIKSNGWIGLVTVNGDTELIIYYMLKNGDLIKTQTILLDNPITPELTGCSNYEGNFVIIALPTKLLKLKFDGEKFDLKMVELKFIFNANLISMNSNSTVLSLINESKLLILNLNSLDSLKCITFPNEVGFQGVFSKFDPKIFFACDDFCLKIYSVSNSDNQVPLQLIQIIPLEHDTIPNYSVCGLYESLDGKYLYLGSSKGISQFKILSQNKLNG
jgi:hypothetical protein